MGTSRGCFNKKNEERRESLSRAEKIMLTDDSEELELYVLQICHPYQEE